MRFSVSTLQKCLEVGARSDYIGALKRLQVVDKSLHLGDLDLTLSDHKLRDFAEARAKECRDLVQRYPNSPHVSYALQESVARRYTLVPAATKPDGLRVALVKMGTGRWWIRQLRSLRRKLLDSIQRDIGLVQRHAGGYCGEHALSLFTEQQERNAQYLEGSKLINELGEELSLAEVTSHTVSNPAIRRAELMVRLRGFEAVADLLGHAGSFYTLTTPSAFHATLHDGRPNPQYRGHSPKDGQIWLCHTWELVRAKLHREGLRPYGFRAAEPHHDGTPHWHFVLFAAPEDQERITAIFRSHALRDPEPGSAKHRFKAIAIDKAKGSATGYFAKYISKNIDGAHIETDLHGNDAQQSARRITAWARTWDIRQFQQVGGPSVTVWRELRRMREADEHPVMESARLAADSSDWAAFVMAMGGVDVARCDRTIEPYHALRPSIDVLTGETSIETQAWHGGPRVAPIQGLRVGTEVRITRTHVWTAVPKSQLPDSDRNSWARSVPAASNEYGSQRRAAPPWTRVNNCTSTPTHPFTEACP